VTRRTGARRPHLAGVMMVIALAAATLGAPAPARAAGPSLSVRAAALIEGSTGHQLYGFYQGGDLAIASTTKLMTALLTMEHVHNYNTTFFTQNNYYAASVDSQIGLVPGERMSVHDLLLALLLPSADDAAEDLAYNVGRRSVGRFVAWMNYRAQQLHLGHTHYSTPIGLDTPGNYSCAADLVKLARYLLTHHPWFRHAVATPSATLYTGNYVRHVVNRNDLVGRIPWINGVKTGHTSDAGYVLVGSGTQHGMTLISAVLGTSSEAERDSNTVALLDWGFANFHLVQPISAGRVLARLPVKNEPGLRVPVIAATTFKDVVPRTPAVHIRLELPKRVTGPKKRHAIIGTAVILSGHRTLARIRLLLARAVPAVSPVTLAERFITRPITLLSLGVLLVAVLIAAGFRWARVRGRRGDPEPAA
jgi:serine-type D-Ala-D-Ala carboxypeptidase (penicillin-binding protein 5/6)